MKIAFVTVLLFCCFVFNIGGAFTCNTSLTYRLMACDASHIHAHYKGNFSDLHVATVTV